VSRDEGDAPATGVGLIQGGERAGSQPGASWAIDPGGPDCPAGLLEVGGEYRQRPLGPGTPSSTQREARLLEDPVLQLSDEPFGRRTVYAPPLGSGPRLRAQRHFVVPVAGHRVR